MSRVGYIRTYASAVPIFRISGTAERIALNGRKMTSVVDALLYPNKQTNKDYTKIWPVVRDPRGRRCSTYICKCAPVYPLFPVSENTGRSVLKCDDL